MERSQSHLDAQTVAQAIDLALESWPGNCFGVASKIVKAGLIPGQAVYGHYLGPVAPGTLFDGRPIIRHGWIRSPEGVLYDPTRFVFEGVAPYICKVPATHSHEYDEGGNMLRMMLTTPVPAHDSSEKQIPVPEDAQALFTHLLQRPYLVTTVTMAEAFWLSGLSVSELHDDAATLYSALIAMKLKALIPFDNLLIARRNHPENQALQ